MSANITKTFELDDMPVEITKKKMRNMYIRIDHTTGVVKVSVPSRVSFDAALKFVEKNIDWVRKSRQQAMQNLQNHPREYISGEKLLLWGEEYDLEFVPAYEDKGVYIKDNVVVILAPMNSTTQDRQELVDKWYRQELSEKMEALKEKCCGITQKYPTDWRIKDMKTKWGTCNYAKERIWISLGLAQKPPICLEYVMIHELTHLYVHNHGPEFKAYMDKFCPDWRNIRRILNNK